MAESSIPISMPLGDPEAGRALQRVLRVAVAHGGTAEIHEIGRVVTEILGDGDRALIAQRVAWLVWMAGMFAALAAEMGEGEVEDQLVEFERQIEAVLVGE